MARKQKIREPGIHASSKRKMAIARGTLKKGKGNVWINSILLNAYGSELARERVREPLTLSKPHSEEVDIKINVKGGGWNSQAEAVRSVIAKTILKHSKNEDLRKKFVAYDRQLLVADTRRTEPQKPYRSGARSKRQTSKR